jgi:hypothetical protein
VVDIVEVDAGCLSGSIDEGKVEIDGVAVAEIIG